MATLYIHIPFCRKKCFYCSFSVAVCQDQHAEHYVRCLREEMQRSPAMRPSSIYFGGGSPSHLTEKQFMDLIAGVQTIFPMTDCSEITVEVNPEDVSYSKLMCYRDAGVTRLSLGVQTFHDPYLKFLGRGHTGQQARRAYDMMRENGFDNINIDVMYGLKNQTISEIETDLREVIRLSCDHVSAYSLTIDEGSRFFVDQKTGPDAQMMAQQYALIKTCLSDGGFEQYEVSNFSKPGKQCHHNINYWDGGNYLGVGMGAHSHQDGRRWWNVPRVLAYIEKIRKGQPAMEGEERLSNDQRLAEAFVFGLRMMKGVDVNALESRMEAVFSEQQHAMVAQFVRDGFLARDNGRVRATHRGVLVLDELSTYLL